MSDESDAPATVTGARQAEREAATLEGLSRRLDKPMGALGVVFLLVVLGQTIAESPGVVRAFTVVGWLLWAVFVAEFVVRAVVADDKRRFWKRNWWQVLFLLVPFLRFVRALAFLRVTRVGRALRVTRVGGVLSAAVRGSRSAGRLLSGRLAWLAVVTAVVVLSASQALYLLDVYDDYAPALHAAAMATITGEPMTAEHGLARVLEVVLALYSVGIFATLAAALGAYWLDPDRQHIDRTPSE